MILLRVYLILRLKNKNLYIHTYKYMLVLSHCAIAHTCAAVLKVVQLDKLKIEMEKKIHVFFSDVDHSI